MFTVSFLYNCGMICTEREFKRLRGEIVRILREEDRVRFLLYGRTEFTDLCRRLLNVYYEEYGNFYTEYIEVFAPRNGDEAFYAKFDRLRVFGAGIDGDRKTIAQMRTNYMAEVADEVIALTGGVDDTGGLAVRHAEELGKTIFRLAERDA